MTTITISVETDVERTFREHAKEAYGGRKGYLGDAVTEAMKRWVGEHRQEEIARRAAALWGKGHRLGRLRYTAREELHER